MNLNCCGPVKYACQLIGEGYIAVRIKSGAGRDGSTGSRNSTQTRKQSLIELRLRPIVALLRRQSAPPQLPPATACRADPQNRADWKSTLQQGGTWIQTGKWCQSMLEKGVERRGHPYLFLLMNFNELQSGFEYLPTMGSSQILIDEKAGFGRDLQRSPDIFLPTYR